MIAPLLKKPSLDRNSMANYRPVSNLPFLSKVVEKIVAIRLNDHLRWNELCDPFQSAYRTHHSCETAILYVQSVILGAMDRGEVTLLAMIDLSAAFDTVNHELLVSKLRTLGVTDTAEVWLRTYLRTNYYYYYYYYY